MVVPTADAEGSPYNRLYRYRSLYLHGFFVTAGDAYNAIKNPFTVRAARSKREIFAAAYYRILSREDAVYIGMKMWIPPRSPYFVRTARAIVLCSAFSLCSVCWSYNTIHGNFNSLENCMGVISAT